MTKITVKDILANHFNFKIPKLDLELLLAKLLNCSRTRLYSHPESTILKKQLKSLKQLTKKRSKGVPLAYLTNSKEFYGYNFYVDERVLIPRPETEAIIDTTKDLAQEIPSDLEILDIGCGSGAIGIALSKELPKAKVTCIDICRNALEVTKINAEKHNSDITTIQSNLIQDVTETNFDIITANLPYIGEQHHRHISKETEKNEPSSALFAGKDGLDLYRELFKQLKSSSINFKFLIGEFGFGQEQDIRNLLKKHFNNYEIKNDLSGIPRIFIITNS